MHLKCLGFHKRNKNGVSVVAQQLFLSIFLLIALASCTKNLQIASTPELLDAEHRDLDVLEKAYQGVGGKQALSALVGLYIEDSRDRYLMGQGPEPGVGCSAELPQKQRFHMIYLMKIFD